MSSPSLISKKPKILIVTTTFPRWENDPLPAPFVFELALHLKKYFDITVLAPYFPGSAEKEVWQGIEILRFRYFFKKYEFLADGGGIQNHLRQSFFAKLLLGFFLTGEFIAGMRILRRRKYFAVNSHWLVPSGLIFSLLCRWFKIPHICTAHASDFYLLMRIPLGKGLLRFICRNSKAIVVVNQHMQEEIKKICKEASVFYQPMGVSLEKFDSKKINKEKLNHLRNQLNLKDFKVVLFVGKLTEKKGVHILLEAIEILKKEIPIKLLIVGEGMLREWLEKRVSELEIQKQVIFLGAKPHSELIYYYQLADVVVVPSLIDRYGEAEGMPVVILEALASGKPVVGTKFCFAPQILKEAGFLEVQPTPKDIANGIKKILKGKTAESKTFLELFSWEKVAGFYKNLIKESI